VSSIIRADKWQNALGVAYNAVLQVVSTAKTDTFTHSSNVFTDVTGLSVSITPKFSNSKILVMFTCFVSTTTSTVGTIKLLRDSTDIFVGDAAGSRTRSSQTIYASYGGTLAGTFLDSPATTSAVTYKIQARANDNAASIYINRTITDTDSAVFNRNASSITVMEIAQ
jgi:hypothetical protein